MGRTERGGEAAARRHVCGQHSVCHGARPDMRPMNKDFVGECRGELFEKQNQQTQILGPRDWPKTRPELRLHRPSRK